MVTTSSTLSKLQPWPTFAFVNPAPPFKVASWPLTTSVPLSFAGHQLTRPDGTGAQHGGVASPVAAARSRTAATTDAASNPSGEPTVLRSGGRLQAVPLRHGDGGAEQCSAGGDD